MDRQTKAVAEAIAKRVSRFGGRVESYEEWDEEARAAIAASDAKYIPGLVDALKEIAQSEECHEEWYRVIAQEAIAQLPEDLR